MIVDLRAVRQKRVITVGLKKLIAKRMKRHRGTLFSSAIRLDGVSKTNPDLSADIEKVRYKIVWTLPCRTTLYR